uniref:uncharacterized protein LOC120343428 n=1 Tax=Styela clava TaxID=7725 RepID=UPI001939A6F0|nr:uncharacterized protein LOC120343428 [Styela clava]
MEMLLQEFKDLKQYSIENKAKIYEMHDLCPVRYNNKCFFGIFDYDAHPTYEIAEVLCDEKGAKLANIYSEEHMEALGNYIRPYIVLSKGKLSSILVYTGMEFNPAIGVITLTDGTQSDLDHWLPGHPKYENLAELQCYCMQVDLEIHPKYLF